MRLLVLLTAVLPCVVPLSAHAQGDCHDPTMCIPGATVPVTVTILSAQMHSPADPVYPFLWFTLVDQPDLFCRVWINGVELQSNVVDGDPHPVWRAADGCCMTVDVPIGLGVVPIDVEMWDNDFPLASDPIDISDDVATNTATLNFDLCTGETFERGGLGTRLASPNGQFELNGDDGDADAPDWATLRLKIGVGEEAAFIPPRPFCDLQVKGCDLIQTVNDAPFLVPTRPAVMRVQLKSTFNDDVPTFVECHVNDFIGDPVVRLYPITIPACGVIDTFFLVEDPVTIDLGSNGVQYGAIVDPGGVYHFDNQPVCMFTNDGGAANYFCPVRTSRPINVTVTRYEHISGGDGLQVTDAQMNAAADALETWIKRLYPCQHPVVVNRDPDVTWTFPYDLFAGPWSEIETWSRAFQIVGQERTIGLVYSGWFFDQAYKVFPNQSRVGASLGKYAPGFAIAEIEGAEDAIPPHELAHTFGLSEEPCKGPFIAGWWICEDEYGSNRDYFVNPPFEGSGFDLFGDAPGPITGTCIMDNETPRWISLNDYMALADALEGITDPRVLVVSGYVDAYGNGHLDAANGLAEGTPNRSGVGAGPYTLAVLDDARSVVGEHGIFPQVPPEIFLDNDGADGIPGALDQDGDCIPDALDLLPPFGVQDSEDDDGLPDGDQDQNCIPDCFPVPHMDGCRDTLWFNLTIPWPRNGIVLELRGPTGIPVASLALDELPIPIELVEPLGDLEVDPREPVLVRWGFGGGAGAGAPRAQHAPDALSDVLVAASYDGGQTWFPRAVVQGADEYVLPNNGLAEPVTMRVRVYALQNGLVSSSEGGLPTAARLAAFRATAGPAGVVLSWSTSGRTDLVGYHIDRTDAGGTRVRLTASPMVGGGTSAEITYVDGTAMQGGRYAYTLLGVDAGGSATYLGQASLIVPDGAVTLTRRARDPFRGSSTFVLGFPASLVGERYRLEIYDLGGRLVARVGEGSAAAEHVEIRWNGLDDRGQALAAGMYVSRLSVGGSSVTGRLLRM